LPNAGRLRPKHVAIKTQSEHQLIVLFILYCCVGGNFTIIRGLWNTTGCPLRKWSNKDWNTKELEAYDCQNSIKVIYLMVFYLNSNKKYKQWIFTPQQHQRVYKNGHGNMSFFSFHRLFYDAFSTQTILHQMVKWLMNCKGFVKWEVRPNWVTILAFAWRDWGKQWKPSVRIDGIPIKTCT
jgi:hypothetical protein